MDWLGSSEVIHVGIGCKVLSLILNEDKVIGFWPFLLNVYLTHFSVVIFCSGVLGGCRKALSREDQVS